VDLGFPRAVYSEEGCCTADTGMRLANQCGIGLQAEGKAV